MKNKDNFEVYKIDAEDEFINGAYDGYGGIVTCTKCDGELRFRNGGFECQDCGYYMERSEFFDLIDAQPPFDDCETCDDNFPLCTDYCVKIHKKR